MFSLVRDMRSSCVQRRAYPTYKKFSGFKCGYVPEKPPHFRPVTFHARSGEKGGGQPPPPPHLSYIGTVCWNFKTIEYTKLIEKITCT